MDKQTRCGIEAQGVVRTPWHEMSALRDDPCLAAHLSHLKMSDDQTVMSAAAVARAIKSAGWQDRSFHDWGVIAAPRYLGRTRVIAACTRYRKHNIRGYSPLIIPHQSLHAIAGTLSIALGIHGPNFGVGGGPDHVGECLLTGLGMIRRGALPGLWMVVSDLDPEPTSAGTPKPGTPTIGQAVALALTPAEAHAGFVLELQPKVDTNGEAPLRVADLADFLLAGDTGSWHGLVDGIGQLTVRPGRCQTLRLAG